VAAAQGCLKRMLFKCLCHKLLQLVVERRSDIGDARVPKLAEKR